MNSAFRHSMLLSLLMFALAGCAGGNKTTETPATEAVVAVDEMENIQFTADTTPMPELSSWIEAANSGDAAAEFVMQMMYLDGMEPVKNLVDGKASDETLDDSDRHKELIRWLERSKEKDFPYSHLASEPSLVYVDIENATYDDNAQKARGYLEEAAKRGYGNAEFVLGMIYWNGLGVSKDQKKGRDLIRRAAEHKIPEAQYAVGMMYELGLGTDKNTDKSLKWLQKAADNGSRDAFFILRMKYEEGVGVPKDSDKATEYGKKDLDYHVWNQLLHSYLGEFQMMCTFNYDQGEVKSIYADDCGGEGDYYPEVEEMSEEEAEKFFADLNLQHAAAASLNYKIDYRIARNWLEASAKDTSHDVSRILLAQIYLTSGCRGEWDKDDFSGVKEGIALIQPGADKQLPVAERALARLYDVNLGGLEYFRDKSDHRVLTEEQAKEMQLDWAKKSFDYFQKAAEHGDKEACSKLSDIYSHEEYEPAIYDLLGIEADSKKAYEYNMKSGNHDGAVYEAEKMANNLKEEGKDQEAVDWFLKAVEIYQQEASNVPYKDGIYNVYFELGQLYGTKGRKLYNMKKAMDYYNLATKDGKYHLLYNNNMITLGLALGQFYQKGGSGIKKNPKLALEWYKRALEATYSPDRTKDALNYFYEQPNAHLKDAVEFQVKLEHGKDPKEFFVTRSAYKPCLKDLSGCADKISGVYKESIQKAIIGITAYSLAVNNKVDLDYINNTFYELALIHGASDPYRKLLANYSPAYAQIFNDDQLYYKHKMMLFYIWYLRQIPYAAAEEYKKLGLDKTWEDFMKEAKSAVKKDKQLKNGFGYDLLKTIQDFPEGMN